MDFLHNLLVDTPENTGPITHIRGVFENWPGSKHLIIPRTPFIPAGAETTLTWAPAPGKVSISLRNLAMNAAIAIGYTRHLIRAGRPAAIYSRGLLPIAPTFAGILRVPFVWEVNGDRPRELVMEGHTFASRIAARLARRYARQAALIVAVSTDLRDSVIGHGAPAEKIIVLPNGVDDRVFYPIDKAIAIAELGLDSRKRYIVHVGALLPWQGVDTLIESLPTILQHHQSAHVLLVGTGKGEEALRRRGRELGVDEAITFVGHVPQARVPLYIGASDVCVSPKRNVAASPLKLAEYMACERPIVATDIPGFEVVRESSSGVLTKPEDAPALAEAIIKILDEPSFAATCGKNGLAFAREHRSWRAVAAATAMNLERIRSR